ncbi:MAG: ATP-dependent Zn protease [Thermosynechococcaceae cyanobacterium MS004]|nr:ATP-dependent Zn protease [Thermosynechococcaceae cyanobacterium MS004]
MNPLTLNAIALSIFGMTLSVLLSPFLPISPWLPAGLTFAILSAATFDSFRFQSFGLTLVLDTIAQQFPGYRKRVLHHEAGHFLAAYLLGLPIQSYALSLREALNQGQPNQGQPNQGQPIQAGIILKQPEQIQPWIQENIKALCTVWAAGGAAEKLKHGSIQGNEDDMQQLRSTLKALGLSVSLYERQAHSDAQQLFERHRDSYEALVLLMAERRSVAECCAVLKKLQPCAAPEPAGSL